MSKIGSIIFPMGLLGNHVRWLIFLDSKFINPFGEQDIDSKINFISNHVYDESRTWDNWLHKEWQYRLQLDQQVNLMHEHWDWEHPILTKELYLTCEDWNKSFLHYYHINLGLNGCTPRQFIESYKSWHNEFEFLKRRIFEFPSRKIMSVDALFESILPYSWYKEMIIFFGLSDNYESAQKIHTMHHTCRTKSARDFYNYVKSDEFNRRVEQIYHIGYK